MLTTATGIDATHARPIKENGKIVDWKKPTDSQVINEWIAQNTLSFAQYKGSSLEDDWRQEFESKAKSLLQAMLESKQWSPAENSIKLVEHAIAEWGTQKKSNTEAYKAPIEYPDKWITKIGGGNAFMTQEEAQFVIDVINAKIASDDRIDASKMAARAPTDSWLNKVGGGMPFKTPEEAAAQNSAMDIMVADYLSDFALKSAQGYPVDKYLNKVGAGIPFKTPEEAQNIS